MQLIETLHWRYAAKRMNGTKVPQQKIDAILQATLLSASSFGLQPYQVILVEDETLKMQLQPAAYNQPQIAEASHLVIFAAYENITAKHIDDYFNLLAEKRKIPAAGLADFKNVLVSSLLSKPQEANFNWSARQAYIALGTALIAAADEKVDATPMEGFNPAAFDEILGLQEKGLKSIAILALGYRDAPADYLANALKVRKDMDDFVIHLPA